MQQNNSEIKDNNIAAAAEALLFAHGEPLEIKKIAKLINIEEEKVKIALKELEEKLKSDDRGLRLIFLGEKAQLATKPEFSVFLENFIKEEFKEDLTPATLETLSLIAYFGPISRAKIDYFRGVNSSFILRNLLIRGLVERASDSEGERGYLYQLSLDCLKHLGISKIEDLPEYQKFKKIFETTDKIDS